ncbi:MAG: NAD(P)-dependent oxidoreductase [Deltaproteobacteria bacterium]|nr:NAD(P)-dependent oxidoreductase [Deltaproteobacteria bacterium]
MRILLTGITGFIGLHTARLLLEQGHSIVALVRTPSKLPADLAERITVLRGDLGLFQDASLQLEPVDVVIHLAAVICAEKDADYDAVNYAAVADLLGCIGRQAWKPRRLLFASSLAAAGPNPGGDGAHSESDEAQPVESYGRAKRAAELLVAKQPYATTSFRPPIVLGPGDPASLTLFQMARRLFAPLPAGAPQRLSFVDVFDLAEAIVAMANDASDAHRLYFTGSEQRITNHELIRTIAEVQGKRVLVVPVPRPLLYLAMRIATAFSALTGVRNQLDEKQYRQMTEPSFVCTSARLTADTGWRATTGLRDCAKRAAEGYAAAGLLPK